ncbi:hypothetical protein SAMN04488490_0097 [Marinobacter sp. LV10R510-11A]|nr:hypothetical protein SAMN04488490_0097 [Marinobacter sp. LV10R510-11A]
MLFVLFVIPLIFEIRMVVSDQYGASDADLKSMAVADGLDAFLRKMSASNLSGRQSVQTGFEENADVVGPSFN